MRLRARPLVVAPLLLCTLLASCQRGPASRQAPAELPPLPGLDPGQASRLARLALACVANEYPNKLEHVMNDASEVLAPSALHPAFYGCFDWHSSVHGHWMLVRLLRLVPGLVEADQIRAALDRNLTAANIAAEVAYLGQPNRASFERTYGWAWLLKLAEELNSWDDPQARSWSRNLLPLAQALRQRFIDFLPRQDYPIRRGVHPNTAFGLALALDYGRSSGDRELVDLLRQRSLSYFGADRACPAAWEPDGDDFFSPCLMVADLMHRVLEPKAFARWFAEFLPQLAAGLPQTLLLPAKVSDRSDPKIVHLDGLNLSRAWCMLGIARALPVDDAARPALLAAAARHLQATLPHVTSGDYAGEHWLGSFAVYALSVASAT